MTRNPSIRLQPVRKQGVRNIDRGDGRGEGGHFRSRPSDTVGLVGVCKGATGYPPRFMGKSWSS